MDLETRIDPEMKGALNVPELPASWEELLVYRKTINDFMAILDKMKERKGDVIMKELTVPGPKGAPDVPVLIFSPAKKTGNMPGLLYIHGGGFIMCSAKTFSADCERIVENIGCTVISVDYRLAPEYPFPAAPEDCYAALRWMSANASSLSINLERIAIAGESAGAGLTAAVALMARDRKEVKLMFQMILSGCLDDRSSTPSMKEFTNRRTWNQASNMYAWKCYLGDNKGEVSPYAAPARATDLSGLPPAYILTGELDPLRDENIEYASRLLQAGVSTELHVFPRVTHGFEQFPMSATSQRALNEHIDVLKHAFRR